MGTLILAALLACPLLSSGAMAYPTVATPDATTFGYRIYVQNPSPFDFRTGELEIVVRDEARDEYHGVKIALPAVTVPAKKQISIDLGQQPEIDPRLLVGFHVGCRT